MTAYVGTRAPRVDSVEKVTGGAVYGVDVQIAGTLQNRVISIPVQTGDAGAKPVARYSGKVSVGASGESVVSMPAETEIIPVEPQ